jgi:hypothetical protein
MSATRVWIPSTDHCARVCMRPASRLSRLQTSFPLTRPRSRAVADTCQFGNSPQAPYRGSPFTCPIPPIPAASCGDLVSTPPPQLQRFSCQRLHGGVDDPSCCERGTKHHDLDVECPQWGQGLVYKSWSWHSHTSGSRNPSAPFLYSTGSASNTLHTASPQKLRV